MDGAPSPTTQRLWLSWLATEWRSLNRRHLEEALEPPQFALSAARSRFGSWNSETRTLSIGLEHILRSPWIEVQLTLRHEMAHQVVDELFRADGAPAHGELFRRACRMLDLDESPRLARERPPGEARVIDRVRKLLNLAGSPNVNEAKAAAAAANRLLLKHNLAAAEAEDESDYTYRWLGPVLGRISLDRKLIAAILQDHFFIQAIWVHTVEPMSQKRGRMLEILGQPHNLDIAEYVHDYLLATLERLWAGYRVGHAPLKRPGSQRNSFRVGALQGFREHLAAQKTEVEEQEGLIWLGDPGLDELLDRRYPRRGGFRASSYAIGDAHSAGVEAGRQIRVRPAMSGDSQTNRGRRLNFEP
jgi:hypothetical protein